MIPSLVTTSLNLGLLALVLWAIGRARRAPVYLQIQGRVISGACLGIARASGVRVSLVRAGFVTAALLGAHAIIAYLALELVLRWDPAQRYLLWSNRLWARLRGVSAR